MYINMFTIRVLYAQYRYSTCSPRARVLQSRPVSLSSISRGRGPALNFITCKDIIKNNAPPHLNRPRRRHHHQRHRHPLKIERARLHVLLRAMRAGNTLHFWFAKNVHNGNVCSCAKPQIQVLLYCNSFECSYWLRSCITREIESRRLRNESEGRTKRSKVSNGLRVRGTKRIFHPSAVLLSGFGIPRIRDVLHTYLFGSSRTLF